MPIDKPAPIVTLPGGETLPALGLGTWHMGEEPGRRATEVRAIRLAIEMGYRVIDTAEMYGEGGAEEVLGEAVAGALKAGEVRREDLFIVSKVYPHNASRSGTRVACERSLKRLGLSHIDLYLLHWRGPHALADTVAAFEQLKTRGQIRHWGVSNLDTSDMDELSEAPEGGQCAANQVYYSLGQRGVEFSLLPWLRRQGMPAMAYCPIAQGALAGNTVLASLGERHGVSAAQMALAWVMAQPGVMAIPKAVQEAHLRDNFAASTLALSAHDIAALDHHFPPPKRKTALAMQ